jgi:two-component system sensor histidine kinase HydH
MKKRSVRAEQHERTERMVAALAHEIKNPLNSMKGASQYLHDMYHDKKDIFEFTGIIIEEINRLERYLNEFISFSRGMNLRLKLTNLTTFITGIIMIVKHSFPTEIKLTVKKSGIPDIYIDPEQLRQVMVNFFSNAKDALEGVKDPEAEVILNHAGKNALITLRDNGKGISKKDIKHIFLPFYTTKESGLGIGLAISKTIVSKHGGRITVKSAENKGSEFTISIPVEKRGKRDE